MAHRKKKITKAMIRRHFGSRAEIHEKFFGGFIVRMPGGGEVEIDQHEFKIHSGGDDVHQAMTTLGGEAWGGLTASGSAEEIMTMLAHGEASGVDVTPEVKPGCGCLSVFVTFLVFMLVLGMAGGAGAATGSAGGFIVATLVAGWVWSLMNNARKREAQRQAQALRYPFPRVQGSARYSTDEDLQKGGLI
jgi:uncharacterized protein (DUF697 family)